MNWLALLLCMLLHALRTATLVGRSLTPNVSVPGWNLFRDMGDPPVVNLTRNGATASVDGRVQGSSDTPFPANLSASIEGEFRSDFGISADDLVGDAPHEIQVDIAVNGIYKHKVSDFSSPGLQIWGAEPTDASSTGEVTTMVQVFEVGVRRPLTTEFSRQFLGGMTQDDQNGPVRGDLQLLVPQIDTVATSETFVVPFTPTGSRNLMVRVSTFVRARARGASAECIIAAAANGTSWNDPVTGSMTVTVNNVRFRQALVEGTVCEALLG